MVLRSEHLTLLENPYQRLRRFGRESGIRTVAFTDPETILDVRKSIDEISDNAFADVIQTIDLATPTKNPRPILVGHDCFDGEAYSVSTLWLHRPTKYEPSRMRAETRFYTSGVRPFRDCDAWIVQHGYKIDKRVDTFWRVDKQIDNGKDQYAIQGAIPPRDLPSDEDIINHDHTLNAMESLLLEVVGDQHSSPPKEVTAIITARLNELGQYHLGMRKGVDVNADTVVPTAQQLLHVLKLLRIEQREIIHSISSKSVEPKQLTIVSNGEMLAGSAYNAPREWDGHWRNKVKE